MRIETARLALRELTHADTAFIVELLNQPSFLRFIGDRGVRNEADAVGYLDRGPLASYARHGFGLLAVEPREGGTPLGICGLLKRDYLEEPDLGFAYLPSHWRRGYAREAAQAVLDDAATRLAIRRVAAITSLDNDASIALLQKLGFVFVDVVRPSPDQGEVKLFRRDG